MIKNENFLHICGWMINELQLKGNELIIYAAIHGFSQDGKSDYHGGLNYLEEWTNSTKQGVIKSLKSLVEKGLIVKKIETLSNNVRFCRYWTAKSRADNAENFEKSNEEKTETEETRSTKFTTVQENSGKQSLLGGKQSLMGGKQSLPNNILNNNKFKNLSSSEIIENIKNKQTEKENLEKETKNDEEDLEKNTEERQKDIFNVLKQLFGSTELFTKDFVPKLSELCKERNLEPKDYVTWTYEHLQKKQVQNFTGYFFKTILSESNISLYLFEKTQSSVKENESEQKKKPPKTKCKVCGAEHLLYADCPICGLGFSEREDSQRISFYKKRYLLPAAKRNAMDKEIQEMRNKSNISVWSAEKNKIYKKYGVI